MSGRGFTVEGGAWRWIAPKGEQKVVRAGERKVHDGQALHKGAPRDGHQVRKVATRKVCKVATEAARDRLERAARCKERRCLTCGDLFISEGPHHRMCARCRAEARAMGW